MQETPYIVRRDGKRWTIRFCGRTFDRFEDRDDAILTALMQVQSARRRGHPSQVLVEEDGRRRVLWGEDPADPPAAARRYTL